MCFPSANLSMAGFHSSGISTNAERMKEITDRLEAGIQALFESEQYKNYLTAMSKFHNYSFNNGHFLFLGQRLPVRAGDGPAAGVQLFHLPPHLVGGRGQNLDGPLPTLYRKSVSPLTRA